MADEKLVGTFEMLWDCSFCGKTRLLAITHRFCAECGAPQDQTKRYFPKDEEKVAVKDDYAGADRICPNCNNATSAKTHFCTKCGAPLDEAAQAKKRSERSVMAGGQFEEDNVQKAEAELAPGAKPKPVMQVKKKSWAWLYILIAVAGLIFLTWFMCFRKKSADFEVMAQHWTKKVVVEKYTEVKKSDWQDRVPSKATRLDNCHDKERSSNKVADGQDCKTVQRDKGNGSFEEVQQCTPRYRNEPVYDTYCDYWVMEWVEDKDRTVTAVADNGEEPPWPETGVKKGGLAMEGSLREGARTEVFTVDLKEKSGREHHCDLSKDTWEKLKKGTQARGTVRARSGEIVCSDLKPKK